MLNPFVIRIFRDPKDDLTEDLMKKFTWKYANCTLEKYCEFDYIPNYFDDCLGQSNSDYIWHLKELVRLGNIITPDAMWMGLYDRGMGWYYSPSSRIEAIQANWDF